MSTSPSAFVSVTTAVVMGLLGASAQANVLTFESGVMGGVSQSLETYTEDSFTLVSPELYMARPNQNPAFVGLPDFSTRMFVSDHQVTMTAADQSVFSAQHVDLGSYFGVNPMQAFVTFSGLRSDGSSVSQTFTAGAFIPYSVVAPNDQQLPGNYLASTMDTHLFSPEFSDLRSLSWNAVSRGAPGAVAYYVDNLTVSSSAVVSPVPEPETWAMMAMGLGIMGWVGRRRGLGAR